MQKYRHAQYLLLICLLVARTNAATPTLRHLNYLALEPLANIGAEVLVDCKSHGQTFQNTPLCRLIEADGSVAVSKNMRAGETLKIACAAGTKRRLALEINSSLSLAIVQPPTDLAWALVARENQPLRTIDAWGPLFFFMPRGIRKAALWIEADVIGEAARIVVRAPDGSVVLTREEDFNNRTKIEWPVPQGSADQAWSVTLERCTQQGWRTDDVTLALASPLPGLLSPRPEWALQFAQNRKPVVSRRASSEKLVAQPPTRRAYQPPPGDTLAEAFTRQDGAQWRTSLPFTYVLDYGAEHLGNTNYIVAVASAPPTLLHLGKDVPLNHGWGPVRAMGGENVAYGTGDAITRLTPDEVAQRLTALRQMVSALHTAGVRYVTPYICSMTLNGDPVKRSGFWDFYDHWEAYRPLGLGPRPPQDPLEWLQTTVDGKPLQYYTYDPKGFYPAFETNHRFAACWHSEGWRTWLLEVVRFVARTGCDGVFVDNGRSQKSYSPATLNAFRAFLQTRYTPAQARTLLGINNLATADFPDKRAGTLVAGELNRFWCSTMRAQMAEIKAAGSQILGREFLVFPNGGNPEELQAGLCDTDFAMFEKSVGPYGTHPGLVSHPILDDITLRSINDNIFEYLFVRSLRARVRPIILTRGGYPRTLPYLDMNVNAARLGMAECAAFSGGGGFLLRPRFDIYHDALNEYREFIETHPELYAGLLPWSDTVIMALPEQTWFGNTEHLAAIKRMTPVLASAHVRFEFASESRLDANPWEKAQVVAAYQVTSLANRHLQSLARFVERGGTLLVAGTLAEKNEYLQPRTAWPTPLDALKNLDDGQTMAAGQGKIVRMDNEVAFTDFLGRKGIEVACADGKPTTAVRLSAYCSPDQTRIILHLLNYLTPLGFDTPPVEDMKEITFTIPLPQGQSLKGCRVLSPDQAESLAANVSVNEHNIKIRLARLHIYAVAEIKLSETP